MAPGCPEQISYEFLWYILRTHRRYRRKAREFVAAHPERSRTIRTDAEARDLLQELESLRITAS